MRKSRPTPRPEKPLRGFRPDAALDKAMLKLQARDGISFSEQLKRAMEAYLTKRGVYTAKKEKP
jgi:hypothetical protein